MWTPEYRNCPVCNSSDRKTIGQRGGRAHRTNLGMESTVVRCKECELLYTYPTLVPGDNPYNDTSFEDYFKHHDDEAKVRAGENQARRAAHLIGRTGSVLEVGCGGGGMLQGFKNLGWQATGVEMTKGYADVAESRGLKIIRQPIEEANLDEKFDVVILPAIIEHLYEPLEMLRKCAAAVNDGGYVHIEAPNESSLSLVAGNFYNKLKGRDWTINLSPTFPSFHVVGFNPKSIKTLVDRAGLKLEILEITPYQTTLPDNVPAVERYAMIFLQKFGSLIGRGDGLTVWARKT